MKNCCDLHTHSAYSDGTLMPAELIEKAKEIGLGGIALTDHNTVAGLPELFRAAQGTGIEAVGGVELSTDYGEIELHLIGLFIREEHFDVINGLVAELDKRKDASNVALCKTLRQAGYDVDLDEIKAKTPKGVELPPRTEEGAEDTEKTRTIVSELMGKKPEFRFKFITEHAQFVKDLFV